MDQIQIRVHFFFVLFFEVIHSDFLRAAATSKALIIEGKATSMP